jgi:hypothetical protein
MKPQTMRRVRIAVKSAGVGLGLLLIAAAIAPFVSVDSYRSRLKASIERELGRQVQLGSVRFSLWGGPRFIVSSITIHEDPAIGIEPIVYVQEPGSIEVAPRIRSLLTGKFVIGAIHLAGASINLAKTGPGSEMGRWNFASFLANPSLMQTAPAIHVRDSRINFKFGDTKAVFYLTNTDFDLAPYRPGVWFINCSAMPARTDRSAQGLGSFNLWGRWYAAPERVDLDLQLIQGSLGDLTALVRGQAGMVHGSIISRLHLGGPMRNIGIQGALTIEDVHRWDLMPPHGQGWPLEIRGRLDLPGQQLELQAHSASDATPPLSVRFRVTDYLSQPHWAASWNWNRFPVAPLMELITHMGAEFPPGLKLAGTIDGAVSYSGDGHFQGSVGFHDTALTIPNSPPVRFEQAFIVLDRGHARLSPALVRTGDNDQAQIEADYTFDSGSLDLAIRTDGMKVGSLHAQAALAAVPWFEQVKAGRWSGQLRYRHGKDLTGWAGRLELADARIDIPGFAEPLLIGSGRAQIDGARVVLDRIEASIGKIEFSGDYRYEPSLARPHRVRLRAELVDAAALEAALMPTLRRSSGLIARALGRRAPVPEWLRQWSVEGTIQIDDLLLGGTHVEAARTRLMWDVARVELDGIQARMDGAALAGKLAINLRGDRPAYTLTANVKGLSWQSGKIDVEGTFETSGMGSQLLANLSAEGTFTGAALDFGTLSPWRTVSGTYSLAPRLRLSDVNLRTEDESFTGRGSTQDDGRLQILLTNGTKEVRMIGPLANLRMEEAAR